MCKAASDPSNTPIKMIKEAKDLPIKETKNPKNEPKVKTEIKQEQKLRKDEHYTSQIRSNIVIVIRLISKIKFTDKQMTQLKKNHFWNLKNAIIQKKLTDKDVKKFDDDATMFIQRYKRGLGSV